MSVVALVQARMGSSRLPGKVLADIEGRTMIDRVVARTARASLVDEVVVLTTVSPADDAVAAHCEHAGLRCLRGSEEDVLDRYYQATRQLGADPILRITGDCPLIDGEIIDRAIEVFRGSSLDYVSYEWPEATFPRGLDVEVLRADALTAAWQESDESADREHVTRFIYRHPDHFQLGGFAHGENLSNLRWTVDAPADLEFVRAIYREFGRDDFGWREVLALLRARPDIAAINAGIPQKTSGTRDGH